jgi:abortive infection bacteriophage resistance protein
MNKTTFKKSPFSYDEHINLLKERNLIINNEKYAKHKLSVISYYRLSAYFRPFYIRDKEIFRNNTLFEDIIKLYYFDKKLRKIIFDTLENIEIFLRTKIIELISKEGAFGYLTMINKEKKDEILNRINRELNRSKEVFIKHYKNKYLDEYYPIWMIVETISFSLLSMLLKNLDEESKIKLANDLNLSVDVLESWLHNLVYIRNICAHHSRIWNRILAIRPKIPRKKEEFKGLNNKKLFFSLCVIQYFLNFIDEEENSLKKELQNLFLKYPEISKRNIGFPDNWEKLKIWE